MDPGGGGGSMLILDSMHDNSTRASACTSPIISRLFQHLWGDKTFCGLFKRPDFPVPSLAPCSSPLMITAIYTVAHWEKWGRANAAG